MIGEKIRKRRQEMNLSQKEVAQQVGCSWQSISNVERGKECTTDLLSKIANILGLEIDLIYKN